MDEQRVLASDQRADDCSGCTLAADERGCAVCGAALSEFSSMKSCFLHRHPSTARLHPLHAHAHAGWSFVVSLELKVNAERRVKALTVPRAEGGTYMTRKHNELTSRLIT